MVPPQDKPKYYTLICHSGSPPAIMRPTEDIRPIVNFTRFPLPSCQIIRISALVAKGAAHIDTTHGFTEKVKNTRVDLDDILVSFDVISLFTSVPIDLALDLCIAALDKDPALSERSPIDMRDLGRLLKFSLSNSYFTF
ncbi:hypothetical protein HPB49_002900 [Dermacentor silvarum]|uniref:Uncharacterized protein n=1 Tax=Dermacentor silvarum TaxID=543639 RepID=A0ACB8D2D0_DERSI|nr:hypothetical protein HPB49_002900 [Dermacentor silvarum]